jgi:hypothetical protein
MGEAQRTTEEGEMPLGGNGRSEDVGNRQPSREKDTGNTGALRRERRPAAHMGSARKGRIATTDAGALGRGLSLVFAIAVCISGKRRG